MKPLELLLNWLQIQARWKWNHGAAHQTELFQASSRSRQSHDRCHCEPNTGHVHAVANLQSGTQSDEVYSGVAESRAAEGHRSTKHCQTARPSEGRRPPEPLPKVVSQAFRAGPQAPADLPQKHAQKKTGYACTVTTPVLHAAECRHAAIDMASRDVHQARACTGQCRHICVPAPTPSFGILRQVGHDCFRKKSPIHLKPLRLHRRQPRNMRLITLAHDHILQCHSWSLQQPLHQSAVVFEAGQHPQLTRHASGCTTTQSWHQLKYAATCSPKAVHGMHHNRSHTAFCAQLESRTARAATRPNPACGLTLRGS